MIELCARPSSRSVLGITSKSEIDSNISNRYGPRNRIYRQSARRRLSEFIYETKKNYSAVKVDTQTR